MLLTVGLKSPTVTHTLHASCFRLLRLTKVMNTVLAEKSFVEMHNHGRHIITTLVSWFTFFITVNFLAIGWLATSSGKLVGQHPLLVVLAFVLLFQNCLGVVACLACRSALYRIDRKIAAIAAQFPSDSTDERCIDVSLPLRQYCTCILLMVGGLVSTGIVWALTPVLLTEVVGPSGKGKAVQGLEVPTKSSLPCAEILQADARGG